VVAAVGGTGVCEYEATDPDSEKVMELRATNADNTFLMSSLDTTNMTAIADGDFIRVQAKFYLEAANTCDGINMGFINTSASPGTVGFTNQTKGSWLTKTAYYLFGADVTGNLILGFYLSPSNGDIVYVDDISVKKITNAALVNGTLVAYDSDFDAGTDPKAMLRYSDDGGHTWSNEIWRSVGKIGKYGWRAVWNRLGSSRNRVYELTVSDPVKWVVTGANLEATQGTS